MIGLKRYECTSVGRCGAKERRTVGATALRTPRPRVWRHTIPADHNDQLLQLFSRSPRSRVQIITYYNRFGAFFTRKNSENSPRARSFFNTTAATRDVGENYFSSSPPAIYCDFSIFLGYVATLPTRYFAGRIQMKPQRRAHTAFPCRPAMYTGTGSPRARPRCPCPPNPVDRRTQSVGFLFPSV